MCAPFANTLFRLIVWWTRCFWNASSVLPFVILLVRISEFSYANSANSDPLFVYVCISTKASATTDTISCQVDQVRPIFQLEAAIPSLRLDYQPLTWESEPALLPEGTKAGPVRVVEIEPIPSPVADFDAHMPWVEQLSRQAPSVHQCQPSGVWQLSSGALHTVMSAAGMHADIT